ncbi:MAG: isoaspartyl peptidase/L-asparaginase [Cryomorphaceae bacterium]|nr:isoaspartyl peptidase/L-asparaginase [Cryomorphaceae bacterium]
MKFPVCFFGTLALLIFSRVEFANAHDGKSPIGIVIHGGAGNGISPGNLGARGVDYEKALEETVIFGYSMLQDGATAVQVVAAVIAMLEDNPLFNAGKGAVANSDGEIFHDASIMEGGTRNAGAVAGIFGPKNPILGALAVMDASPHVMLIGEGAEDFCRTQGLYFLTPEEKQQYLDAVRKPQTPDDKKRGTVGCVVLDMNGNLAAGTSTGGTTKKLPGRVGDSPIIGAGTYADNRTCAVSATGHGEYFIRSVGAYAISAAMLLLEMDLHSAVQYSMDEVESLGGDGGFIAIDRNGIFSWGFNTTGMFRAARTSGMVNPLVELYGER